MRLTANRSEAPINKEARGRILGLLKVAATCLFLSRKARTIISMLALNPQTGKSSGASLGVPSEALLHRHNAAVHIGTLGTHCNVEE